MMKILRIICSPRGLSSESYQLSQTIISHLSRQCDNECVITERDVRGLAHIDADYAEVLSKRRDSSDKRLHKGTFLQSEQLIQELEDADYVVIATPMHNLTIPSALKAWLDHVIQVDRTFRITPEGKVGTLRDSPVFIAVSSGGTFSADTAQQPNFLTPYLTAALATVGLRSVTFFSVEGTARNEGFMKSTRENSRKEIALYFSGTAQTNRQVLSVPA